VDRNLETNGGICLTRQPTLLCTGGVFTPISPSDPSGFFFVVVVVFGRRLNGTQKQSAQTKPTLQLDVLWNYAVPVKGLNPKLAAMH
jgi:hypothetical protein